MAHAIRHPLDPLDASEIMKVFRIVEHSPRYGPDVFFPIVKLAEPSKHELAAWHPGASIPRRAFANVYNHKRNLLSEAVIDLRAGLIEQWTDRPDAQPAVYLSEWTQSIETVKRDPRWRAAIKRRGIDPADVYVDIWAPGDLPPRFAATGNRYMRGIMFFRGKLPNPYDRPIEGIVVTIDMTHGRVVDFVDNGMRPIDTTTSGSARPDLTLNPLVVTQPRGPSFRIDGRAVEWARWRFRVGYTPREGLVLHQIGWAGDQGVRPIVHRLSLSEIYVPYALPDDNWVWRTAFDVGEYNLGQYAELLQKNLDVPENAVFFDEAVGGDTGTDGGVFPLPHATAIYERDAGSLWDRLDPSTAVRDARYARELVVTAAYPIGNYTYAFEYAFRLDGSIDVRVHPTGTTLNRGVASVAEGEQFGTAMTSHVAAPSHQHFVSFRIDFAVDGDRNRLVEIDTVNAASPTKNAFVARRTMVTHEGARDTNANGDRAWMIESATHKNALGKPTSYMLVPGETARPYSDADFAPLQRAPFAQHPLWVTRFRPNELYAAGDYPYQGRDGEGLTRYAAGRESLDGEDLVVWYTAGFTHHPDVEEYPVMTADSLGFRLAPSGFFDRNPALTVRTQLG
jgi:primary-amine oxidase